MEPTMLEMITLTILAAPGVAAMLYAAWAMLTCRRPQSSENSCTVWFERGNGRATGRKHNTAAELGKAFIQRWP